eukprot:4713336-Pleurochrysis_carterae.AAC.3
MTRRSKRSSSQSAELSSSSSPSLSPMAVDGWRTSGDGGAEGGMLLRTALETFRLPIEVGNCEPVMELDTSFADGSLS